jgi:hypothetical protein
MANVRERALDVDGFRPNASFALPKQEIEAVFASVLKPWVDSKDGKKGKKSLRLSLSMQDVTFTLPDLGEYTAKTAVKMTGNLNVNFRIKDILALVRKLKDQKPEDFLFAIDDGGLMAVSWTDDVGSYIIHIPTVGKDNKLQSRRVAPMRATTNYSVAAE